MERVAEPELMDDPVQARAYAKADFDEPNQAFVDYLTERFPQLPDRASVVDLGCGPGEIAVRLAIRCPGWTLHAVDGALAMLAHARQAVQDAGVPDRVHLVQGRVPGCGLDAASADGVISNSLLHHLHDPRGFWSEIRRLARPGAFVLVMDLFRPDTIEQVQALVDQYAEGEPEVLRRDFFHSLRAAWRPDEVRTQLSQAGIAGMTVQTVSDRHLLVWGRVPV